MNNKHWAPLSIAQFVVFMTAVALVVAVALYVMRGSFGLAIAAFIGTAIILQVGYFLTVLVFLRDRAKPSELPSADVSNPPPEPYNLVAKGRGH